jgi:hypothetical protein
VLHGLLGKSSGYFIYASTVIKFVDDKNFRPTQRLTAIESLRRTDHFQSPFGALDELYTQILSAAPQHPALVPILRVIDTSPFLECADIDELLGLEDGDTELSLRGLHSILKFSGPGKQASFIHASFSDFVRDPSRAGNFYIADSVGLAELARLVLTELGYMYQDPIKNRKEIPKELCVHAYLVAE